MSKGLEYIKQVIKIQEEHINEFKNCGCKMDKAEEHLVNLKQIEKELKAWAIIKRKPRLDLVYIANTTDYEDYKLTTEIAKTGLEDEDILMIATKKEYDLLKEVLL